MGVNAGLQTRFNEAALRMFNSMVSSESTKLITITDIPSVDQSTQAVVAGTSEQVRAAVLNVNTFRDEEPNKRLGEMRVIYLVSETTITPKMGMKVTLPSGAGLVDSGYEYTASGISEDPSKSVYIIDLDVK